MKTKEDATEVNLIAALKLSAEELAALRFQGFVTSERRGNGAYYKLRFRLAGRQRVVYLGASPEKAAAVRVALSRLQTERGSAQKQKKLEHALRAAMVASKRLLAPRLEGSGFRFHGLQLRKVRTRKSSRSCAKSSACQSFRPHISSDIRSAVRTCGTAFPTFSDTSQLRICSMSVTFTSETRIPESLSLSPEFCTDALTAVSAYDRATFDRYRESASPEDMKAAVAIIHHQLMYLATEYHAGLQEQVQAARAQQRVVPELEGQLRTYLRVTSQIQGYGRLQGGTGKTVTGALAKQAKIAGLDTQAPPVTPTPQAVAAPVSAATAAAPTPSRAAAEAKNSKVDTQAPPRSMPRRSLDDVLGRQFGLPNRDSHLDIPVCQPEKKQLPRKPR